MVPPPAEEGQEVAAGCWAKRLLYLLLAILPRWGGSSTTTDHLMFCRLF
jgi:hypothetical protein